MIVSGSEVPTAVAEAKETTARQAPALTWEPATASVPHCIEDASDRAVRVTARVTPPRLRRKVQVAASTSTPGTIAATLTVRVEALQPPRVIWTSTTFCIGVDVGVGVGVAVVGALETPVGVPAGVVAPTEESVTTALGEAGADDDAGPTVTVSAGAADGELEEQALTVRARAAAAASTVAPRRIRIVPGCCWGGNCAPELWYRCGLSDQLGESGVRASVTAHPTDGPASARAREVGGLRQ